jgi:hypothetical protein
MYVERKCKVNVNESIYKANEHFLALKMEFVPHKK